MRSRRVAAAGRPEGPTCSALDGAASGLSYAPSPGVSELYFSAW